MGNDTSIPSQESHPDITIGFLDDGCSRCRLQSHSTRVVAVRPLDLSTLTRRWVFNSLRNSPLVVLYFLEQFFSRSHELQLRPWRRSCQDLCSSSSTLASRALRTTCCGRQNTVCTCHVTCDSVGVEQHSCETAHMNPDIFSTSLRGVWVFVDYTALPLGNS